MKGKRQDKKHTSFMGHLAALTAWGSVDRPRLHVTRNHVKHNRPRWYYTHLPKSARAGKSFDEIQTARERAYKHGGAR